MNRDEIYDNIDDAIEKFNDYSLFDLVDIRNAGYCDSEIDVCNMKPYCENNHHCYVAELLDDALYHFPLFRYTGKPITIDDLRKADFRDPIRAYILIIDDNHVIGFFGRIALYNMVNPFQEEEERIFAFGDNGLEYAELDIDEWHKTWMAYEISDLNNGSSFDCDNMNND